MSGWIDSLLEQLGSAPAVVIYAVVGVFAGLENIVPPVPADVVALFGALLAGQGSASAPLVFLVVWVCNVATALLVYALGRRYGAAFFAGRWGQAVLKPQQLRSLDAFYNRYGAGMIFVSRFLPMFRAVVPVFAGVSRIAFWRTAVPLAAASGLWYGLIVYLGALAGRNWDELVAMLDSAGRWLWVAVAVAAAAVGRWWLRSR